MVLDEKEAERVRKALGRRAGLTEKKMFSGIGFMLDGNMAVGVGSEGLIVRVAPERMAEFVGSRVKPMAMRGKPIAGWLWVDRAAWKTDAGLKKWVAEGVAYATSLPRKK